jgi:hypothetical protein
MKRSIVLLLGTLVLPSVLGGIPTRYYGIACGSGCIQSKEGKLCVGRGDWDNKDGACNWYLGGSSIKSSTGAGYLAYDPTGKSNKLSLSAKPGDNTDWQMVVTKGKTPGDEHEATATIRAANGPMKGWMIDVEDGQLILSKSASKPASAFRVVLHK